MHFIFGFGIMLNNSLCLKQVLIWIYLLNEIEINSIKFYKERREQICLIKRSNGHNFVICLNEPKKGKPNSIRIQIE
jgi:hypothetical protein